MFCYCFLGLFYYFRKFVIRFYIFHVYVWIVLSLMCFRHWRGIALIILLYSIIVESTAYTMLMMLRSSILLSLYN